MYNPDKINQELMDLQGLLDDGEITQEKYDRMERILLDKLDETRQFQEEGK